MKTFKQYLEQRLDEMPLASYHTDFNFQNPHEEDFFSYEDKQGKTKRTLGRQIIKDKDQSPISGFFSKKDRSIISHPKTAKTLENKLSAGKHKFNILFIDVANARKFQYSPKERELEYYGYVNEFMKKNNITKEDHITFVKNGTSGHLMSPWMILHTVGHAVGEELFRQDQSLKGQRMPSANVRLHVESLLTDLIHHVANSSDDLDESRDTLSHIFMFNSARPGVNIIDSSVKNSAEFFHELIAEYLWNGDKIRIKPPLDKDEEVLRIVHEIEQELDLGLDSCKGKVIYDYAY